jgi:hypothetical protein
VTDEGIDPIVARAMARLREDESTHLASLVDLLVDAALARPIGEAVDPDRVVAATVAVITAERVERAIAELGRPFLDRQRALLASRGDTVGEWLPEGGRAHLAEVLAGARLPRGEWAKGLVATSDLRELALPVLQETLLSFAKKLPIVGGGESGASAEAAPARAAGKLFGLASALAHSAAEKAAEKAGDRAAKLADLGRGVLAAAGGEMEKRVVAAVKDFSQNAFEPLEAAFIARLRSDEGQAILARMRARAVDRVLAARVAEVLADADTLPREPLDELVAGAIAFGASRPELAQMLREEVAAFTRKYEGKTVGEVLDAWQLRSIVVTEARRELFAIAKATAAGPGAEAWLRALLAP